MQTQTGNFFVGYSPLCQSNVAVYLEYLRTVRYVAGAALSSSVVLDEHRGHGQLSKVDGDLPNALPLERRGRAGRPGVELQGEVRVQRAEVAARFVRSRSFPGRERARSPAGRASIDRDSERVADADRGVERFTDGKVRSIEHPCLRGVASWRGGPGCRSVADDDSVRAGVGGLESTGGNGGVMLRFGDAPWVTPKNTTAQRNRQWRQRRNVKRRAKMSEDGAKARELSESYKDRRIVENRLAEARARKQLERIQGSARAAGSASADSATLVNESRPKSVERNTVPVLEEVPKVEEAASDGYDAWSESSFDPRVDEATPSVVKGREMPKPFVGPIPKRKLAECDQLTPEQDTAIRLQLEKSMLDMQAWAERTSRPPPKPSEGPPSCCIVDEPKSFYQRVSAYVWNTEFGREIARRREEEEKIFGPSRERRRREAERRADMERRGLEYRPSFLEWSDV